MHFVLDCKLRDGLVSSHKKESFTLIRKKYNITGNGAAKYTECSVSTILCTVHHTVMMPIPCNNDPIFCCFHLLQHLFLVLQPEQKKQLGIASSDKKMEQRKYVLIVGYIL